MRMRRPLFWAALFLIIIAAVRLESGGPGRDPGGMVTAQILGECRDLTVTAQVYKKDGQTIYLQKASVCLQKFTGSDDPVQDLGSEAGSSRQEISDKEILNKEISDKEISNKEISDKEISNKEISNKEILNREISSKEISDKEISYKNNIICKLEEAGEIPLGSYVTLRGDFAPVSGATNPGEFDGAAYYRILGVDGRLSRGKVAAKGQGVWPVREGLYRLRVKLEERLYRALPEEEAGVLCALLLGDKGGLEEQVEDLYRKSGILHILSISSLHITILGMSLYRLLRRLRVPVMPSALAGSVLLLVYGGLTGFGVSACRAIGMYLIRMLGEVLGRTYDMLTALGVMGALMVWRNPWYLHHSGFLLSYVSVLGVGVIGPALTKAVYKKEGKPVSGWQGAGGLARRALEKLGQSALTSLSVMLATLPVQLWCYYEVPVWSVFLNLLVLPLVKPLMLAGFLLLLFPWFMPLQKTAEGILGWYALLCRTSGKLPFSTWNPGQPRLWQVLGYYLILAAAVGLAAMAGHTRRGRGKTAAAALTVVLFLDVVLIGARPRAANRADFLDVGQGDCILVRTASGEAYLFDCGSTSRGKVGEYVLLPFLKYHGIRKIDAVLVSHPDQDHINGLVELFSEGPGQGIMVEQLILPELGGDVGEAFLELEQLAREGRSGAAVRYVAAGESWECGSARFTCLHPRAGWNAEDANTGSQCFYVEFFQGRSGDPAGTLLLTGDVEEEGERALVEQLARDRIRRADVLKVAHHGSGGATSEEFLDQLSVGLAVISCGRNNRYGHPHEELLDRLYGEGCALLQTRESGAVTVYFETGGIRAETYR